MNERTGKPDRTGRSDRSVKSDRTDRPGRTDRPNRADKSYRTVKQDRLDRPDRSGKSDRTDRPDRTGRTDRPEWTSKTDRSNRAGKTDMPDRTDRPDRTERPDRTGRPDRYGKSDGTDRPDKLDRTDRTDRPDRLGGTEDLDRLEGRNSVLEALKAGRSINKILIAKGEKEGSINQIAALAKQNRVIIQEVDRTRLDTISTTHAHQGVIAFAAAKDYVEVDDILKIAAQSGKPPFLVILDEITDAYNLGSILRTANAAGVHGVIIPKRRAIGLTAAVSKASAGAVEYVPVARVTNITQTIEYLKKKNIWIIGTDSSGEKPFFKSDLTGPVALVVGSEGEGMGRLVRETCDFVVNIPMMGQISSLNAAVAGAIVMYEILRQRSK